MEGKREMKLVTKLRKNDGQFDYRDFMEDMYTYECAFRSLYKNKELSILYKALKCYVDSFRKITEQGGCYSYHPGMDYIISVYSFYLYAQVMEKGVKGVVDKNKEESTYAYLQLLRRFDRLPNNLKHALLEKDHLLLKYAYPDLMDNYSVALYDVGFYYLKKKNYARAFKFFKKGADFDCDGRQIVYPYYLIGKNQDKVGDMYKRGLGVRQNLFKAAKYYQKSAENCGRRYSPKIGDIHYEHGQYAKAFLCYTDVNIHWPWRYSLFFMMPNRLGIKFNKIFKSLNKNKNKTDLEIAVLSMMYQLGLGCEMDVEKGKELLPKEPRWVTHWVNEYKETM